MPPFDTIIRQRHRTNVPRAIVRRHAGRELRAALIYPQKSPVVGLRRNLPTALFAAIYAETSVFLFPDER